MFLIAVGFIRWKGLMLPLHRLRIHRNKPLGHGLTWDPIAKREGYAFKRRWRYSEAGARTDFFRARL